MKWRYLLKRTFTTIRSRGHVLSSTPNIVVLSSNGVILPPLLYLVMEYELYSPPVNRLAVLQSISFWKQALF